MLLTKPPTSVCLTRFHPATKCAYYQYAPPAEPEKVEKHDRPSPDELAATALDRAMALAESPRLSIAPSGVGLTGLPSYVWLAEEPRPIRATAGVRGLTVTAEAHPIRYVWTFGDGTDRVTTHSGRPWSRRRDGNIAHTYETRGRYELSVEVIWEARWRINSGPWRPLGYFSNSDDHGYSVRQVIAVLTKTQ